MSKESQNQQSTKEETGEIELELRAVIRAGKAPETRNDTAEWRPALGDTGNGNDQSGLALSQDPGPTAQSAKSSSNEGCVPENSGQEGESPSHTSQEAIDENEDPIELDGQILFFDITELLWSMLYHVSRLVQEDRNLGNFGWGWTQDNHYDDDSSIIVGSFWGMELDIRNAWPASRDVEGVRHYIIESDGDRTKTRAHWLSLPADPDTPYATIERIWFDWCSEAGNNQPQEGFSTVDSPNSALRYRYKGKIIYCALDMFRRGAQGFPVSLLACALSFEEPFRFSRRESPWEGTDHWDVGKSTSLLSTVFRSGYSVQTDHQLHNTIHWQIRYFSPLHEHEEYGSGCLFRKRETATFDKTILQEKRAVVSFRVLRNAPELFSILVLKDEEMLPHSPIPDQQFDFDMFWKDYGFLEPNKVTPLTYYLLEICRVFEMCMAAWGETLSTIDNLANVKLDDLNDVGKVENLMFDNSFKRSRDYFVALQILRIIDEWIDEVKSTVENMFKDPVLVPASMWPDGSTESFEVAIRYVNEHVTATKSRVRMKQEEINSLRDGLFNATSLRESMKAMALNQAIYVFTVVTVLFTPVSFLAVGRPPFSSSVTMLTKQTFWALPFLNNPTEGTDVVPVPAAFRNSFIIMPILTYALVIGVAWLVGQRNSSNVVLGMIRHLATSAGRLLRRGWNLLPKKTKKRHQRSGYP
ncbi:hypothetical protein FNAPI_2676 [Fusarium napiforme]|uniref:Uncharacterized protein n=1 Tax=Fusarium napiforme TaxID=42672 RepID=A0A8H5NES0_9HYPO|nr:hypothetical protein FNAPI_2676 [Fusarium napiforme]